MGNGRLRRAAGVHLIIHQAFFESLSEDPAATEVGISGYVWCQVPRRLGKAIVPPAPAGSGVATWPYLQTTQIRRLRTIQPWFQKRSRIDAMRFRLDGKCPRVDLSQKGKSFCCGFQVATV